MADRVGQQLGQYRLLRLLGSGGFAEVYLGEHVHLGSQAAIKVLHTNLATPEDIAAFRTEARTLATLVHPHIIRLLDFGVEGSTPFLVLDYAPNGSLRTRLLARTPLPLATVLPLVRQVAEALHYAHEQKLIHRDVKPENLLLGRNNEVLLTDFGIATVAQNTSQQRTEGVAGTAAYMAPEQLQGKPRPASDLYSLGVVVYEWLTGERPFRGGPIEVATQQILTPPPPLREKVPTLPAAVEQVVLTALAKDPRERFGSVRAFATALEQAARPEAAPTTFQTAPDALATRLPTPPGRQPVSAPPASGQPAPNTPGASTPLIYDAPTRLTSPEAPTPSIHDAPTQLTPATPGGWASPTPVPTSTPSTPQAWLDPARGNETLRAVAPPGATPVPPTMRGEPGGLPPTLPPPSRRRVGWVAVLSVVLVLIVVGSGLGVLGANHQGPLASLFGRGVTPTTGVNKPQGCKKIGVLLPESNSSPRWERYDHPLLSAAITQALPGATIDYSNANGSADTQQSQAQADLTNGDCILVVAAHDSSAAAAIVTLAQQQHVPVIAYDRLIQSNDLNYYVSFDGVAVGKLQGQYIVDHYQQHVSTGHNNIVFIDGSPTDNNATLFANGAHLVLDPLIMAGTLNKVYEQFTPNWDPPTGETEMEAALTANNNNVQIVLSANDDLGGAVIQALQAQGLAGRVLVTGQDATVFGLQRILEGTQSMTVYKQISKEAQATAQLVAALSKGAATSSLINGQQQVQSGGEIPSILLTPIVVDKSNISSTVLADGYVTKNQLCTGIPAGTDTGGICS